MLELSKHTPLANLNNGDTPLHCACSNGNTRLVKMLLVHSPRLAFVCDTIMDRHYSPLHIACMEKGNNKVVEIILERICLLLEAADEYSEDSPLDLNVRDANGCTPLYYACYYGHDEIVYSLLKFGRQYKNCKPFDISITTLQQRTPFHAAVQRNHLSTLQVILDQCGQHNNHCIKELVNLVGHPSSDTKSHLLNYCSSAQSSVSVMSQDSQVFTDDFSAIPEKSEDETQEQLSPRSQTNIFHSTQSKPIAVQSKTSSSPARKILKSPKPLTVSHPQMPSRRQRSRTDYSDGSTGLMSLFLTKDGSLLAHPAEHHLENIDKEFDQLFITPLAEACACGHSQAVDMLLSAGASDPEGMAVRLAQFSKNNELARTVLIHHCKVLVENPSSQQPFYSLSIDWSGIKITDLPGSWFVEGSIFFPSSAEDDEGNNLPITSSLPAQLDAFKLTRVSLSNNNIKSLPVELLQLPNLQSLDVSSNLIHGIPSNISCPSLKRLYLSNNILIELPVSVWYLPYLEKLEVKNNLLECIGKDFVGLTRLSRLLRVVDISRNKLDVLPSFVLGLPALEELNISYNELVNLPDNLWECSTLRELDASHNVLVNLPSCEPQSTLMLSQQPHPIPAVQCGQKVVGAKVHVEKLLLNGNKLSMFPDALPCLAPLLIELDVSRNSIEEIDISFLPVMLRKLVASNNKIKKFGTIVNSQLKNHMIQHCRMLSNQYQQCHHRSHKEMRSLTAINLANNQLKHFQLMQSLELDNRPVDRHSMSYSQLDLLYPELENLNISHNCLQGCFNHNIGYQSQLKSITLDGNAELEELPTQFAYFKKSKKFTQLSLYNLPKLRDPPKEYHENKLRTLLSYMSSRLKK